MKKLAQVFVAMMLCVGSLVGSVSAADIVIGTAGPVTGQYAVFGEQMVRGAKMAGVGAVLDGGMPDDSTLPEMPEEA